VSIANCVFAYTDTDEEFNIDEAVPANRGLWVSVVYPGTFDLPESRFQEETGPFNFTPNSSILSVPDKGYSGNV
jgi:hypothetical protein